MYTVGWKQSNSSYVCLISSVIGSLQLFTIPSLQTLLSELFLSPNTFKPKMVFGLLIVVSVVPILVLFSLVSTIL